MLLFNYTNKKVIKPTDDTPDPLFNPEEVTRVKDIMDLHKRGIKILPPQTLRNEVVDDRSDFVKLSSPNLESDKLFPSYPRVVAQNAQYSKVLEQRQKSAEKALSDMEKQKQIDDLKKEVGLTNENV